MTLFNLMTYFNLFPWKFQWRLLNGENTIIGVIYLPPGTDLSLTSSKIADLLGKNKLENKLYYLMGDFNIKLLDYETHELTANFVDTVYSCTFVALINGPARVNKYSAT